MFLCINIKHQKKTHYILLSKMEMEQLDMYLNKLNHFQHLLL